MDPLTQGVLGAAAAQAPGRSTRLPHLALAGGLAGMAPDLDVLIRSPEDPLLFLEYHRQFTHALAFIPIGALACAAILYLPLRRRLGLSALYLACLLGYGTHGLLDACTSYGTLLLWPFSDLRVAWNLVSVIDPLFTLPLLAGVLATAILRRRLWVRLGLAWASAYLALGVLQHERAERFGEMLAATRGHAPEALIAKPSFGNLVVWRLIYAHEGDYFVDAVRLGWRSRHIPGDRVEQLDLGTRFPWLDADSQQARDVRRFRWFSAGYLAVDPDDPLEIVDIRYALVPNEMVPLWGIRLDPDAKSSDHVAYVTQRDDTRAAARRLLALLRGDF